MVPIIPLGKKRILDHCPSCTRHAAMSFGDWEQGKKRADEAIAAYRRKPGDAQLAEEALKLVVGQRNVPAFLELAPEIEKGMRGQAKPLALTASVYAMFSRMGDAERLLRAALEAAKDDDEERNVAEMLADNLIRQGRPEEAEPLLAHIVEDGIPDRVDAIYQLGQAYQRKGNHEKAIAAFDQCQIIFPQIASDKVFNQLRDASLGARGTGKTIDPNKVVKSHKSAASRRRMAKVVPVVALLALAAYFALAWIEGMKSPVYFVNALDHPYDVKVNGASYSLPAERATKLRFAEGDLKVEMPGVEAETVTIRTPFIWRPFVSTVQVINPDGAAVLERNKVYYARPGQQAPKGEVGYFTGRTYYTFDGIDYPFEDFPHEVELKSGGETVSKENIDLAFHDTRAKISIPWLMRNLRGKLGTEPVLRVTQRRAMLEKESSEYLYGLAEMMKGEDLAKFLEAQLPARRSDVWWNREYQYVMSGLGRRAEVEKAYQELLAREPGNKTMMFLAGNASLDPERYLKLVRESAAGTDACPHAFTSLMKYCLATGEVHEAAEWGDKAMEGLPDDQETREVAVAAYTADKQYGKATTILLTDENGKFPQSVKAIYTTNYVYSLQGDIAGAQGSVVLATRAVQEFGNNVVEMTVARLTAEQSYVRGDVNGYATALAKSGAMLDTYCRHVALENLEAAKSALEKVEKADVDDHLLMFILAKYKGDANLANHHMEISVGMLAEGDAEDRAYAAAMSGAGTMPVSQLVRLRDRPEHKRLVLTALGMSDPAMRKECFEMVGKINYEKRFPQRLIEKVLNEGK
jgi:tetratricopeptide (TPR) repeat protein